MSEGAKVPAKGPVDGSRVPRLGMWAAALVLLICSPKSAQAELEVTSNLALGGGAIVTPESRGVFRFGLNTSLTFLRERNTEFGLGVYAEAMTSSFDDIMAGSGVHFLLPVHHGAPIILFAGGHYVYNGHHAGGVGGRIWWGAHNHNHFHPYNASYGIWVEVRANLAGDRDLLVVGGVDIDLALFAYPFLFLQRAVRGPSRL